MRVLASIHFESNSRASPKDSGTCLPPGRAVSSDEGRHVDKLVHIARSLGCGGSHLSSATDSHWVLGIVLSPAPSLSFFICRLES